MSSFLYSEAAVRLAAFLGIFTTMAVYELWSPRLERAEMVGALKSRRWFANLSMVLLSSIVLRIVFPAAAVGAALWAQDKGIGLFNFLALPQAIAGILAFILLDFAVWLEHVASHKIPLLWRIHRMHHADNGFDVTTGLRFHPLEILLSMVWKAGIVVALGAPVLWVLIFEIVLNGTSMFNHSNVRLPLGLDRVLRRFLVTPDMHRVHHSSIPDETIPITVLISRSGIACSAPMWHSHVVGTRRWKSGFPNIAAGSPRSLAGCLPCPFAQGVQDAVNRSSPGNSAGRVR